MSDVTKSRFVWEDASSYSRDDKERIPHTWRLKMTNLTLTVTRKWYGLSYGGWSRDWFIQCDHLLQLQAKGDIEDVKRIAIVRLKDQLEKSVAELSEVMA